MCKGPRMQEKAPNAEMLLAPVDVPQEYVDKAALMVKRHARDEAELSDLLDMLGLAV